MERKGFIGSSDIGTILGLNPYCTPLMLWMQKTGKVEQPDLTGVEAVEMGTELEETVARLFTKRTGKAVRRSPKNYTMPNANWMRCQVDRLITGTDELLECKTASLRKEKDWDGEDIPASYIAQVMWQLMITGRKVGWIACLIGGQKFVYKQIAADEEFFATMRDKAESFWSMVQSDTAPMAVYGDDEALLALHPKDNEQVQNLQEFETAVAHRQELSGQIEALKAEKEMIEVRIKEVIGDNLGFKTEKYKVLWSPYEQSRVEVALLKADGVYEKYAKTISSRRLTVKLNKAV